MKFWEEGEDPDPRFTLANERTFLAWIRTSLAFLAGGLALEIFAFEEIPAWMNSVVSLVLIIVSGFVAVGAAFRWALVEKAMRIGQALPAPKLVPVLSFAAAIGGVLGIVVVVL
ncbi:YidH family protein [Corynebacterium sp. L4756]|uniref:YidH family protein n=1 Tax=unclassified Corynebacterium TaxID=2624378 RepID=UPI00374D12E3